MFMAKCVICNGDTGCTCHGHWKNVACCIEHYQIYLKREGVSGKVKYKLRAFDGKIMWDIMSYTIGADDIKLTTSLSGKILSLKETEYIFILNDQKHNLLRSYDDDGKYIRVEKQDYHNLLKFKSFSKSSKKEMFDDSQGEEAITLTENVGDDVEEEKKKTWLEGLGELFGG
jgi:hypothetical protein